MCFRLHFTKESPAVINTAGATVRQLVSLVFERALQEDEQFEQQDHISGINNSKYDLNQQHNQTDKHTDKSPVKIHHQEQIKTQLINYQYSNTINNDINSVISALRPCAADAYLMFQVLLCKMLFILALMCLSKYS